MTQEYNQIPIQCQCSYFLSSNDKDLISVDSTYQLWWKCPFCQNYNSLKVPTIGKLKLIDQEYKRKLKENIKYIVCIQENFIRQQSLFYLLSSQSTMGEKRIYMLRSLCEESPILQRYNNYKASVERKKNRAKFNWQLFYNRRTVTKLQYILWILYKCFQQVKENLYIAILSKSQEAKPQQFINNNFFRLENLQQEIIAVKQRRQSSTTYIQGSNLKLESKSIFSISESKIKLQTNTKIRFCSIHFSQEQLTISDIKNQSINIGSIKQRKEVQSITKRIYNPEISIFSNQKIVISQEQIFKHIEKMEYGIHDRCRQLNISPNTKIRVICFSKRKKERIEWLYNSESLPTKYQQQQVQYY